MRSSRSGADPLDPGPKGFAHRGLHFGFEVPENSLAAFAAAIDFGAGIECDLRLTADNRIIVFHDSDARRLCASPLRIGRSNWKDLAGLRVGAHPIPTLENLLEQVGGRVPLLLEIKVEGDLHRWKTALGRELAGYRGRLAVLSFDPRIIRLLGSEMPAVRRGLNIKDGLMPLRRAISIRSAAPDFLGVELSALSKPWATRIRRSMLVYSWTIRTAEDRAQAAVHADALIWEGDGRPRI
jgi:glycerophosphoryl diester phosphodiesterase